jgi:hypothetical protein
MITIRRMITLWFSSTILHSCTSRMILHLCLYTRALIAKFLITFLNLVFKILYLNHALNSTTTPRVVSSVNLSVYSTSQERLNHNGGGATDNTSTTTPRVVSSVNLSVRSASQERLNHNGGRTTVNTSTTTPRAVSSVNLSVPSTSRE